MTLLDSARLLIYRCREKGLEVFLLEQPSNSGKKDWAVPSGPLDLEHHRNLIELTHPDEPVRAYAIEADWHDIPSIRTLIKHDVNLVKSRIKESVLEIEKGAYIGIKEALKKVLHPEDYKALKELKDIIIDRNLSTSI